MSRIPKFRKLDYGQYLQFVIRNDQDVMDISSMVSANLILTKPSGTEVTRSMTLSTDGTDGKCRYRISSGDLDESGTWSALVSLTFVDEAFRTSSRLFFVED